MAIAMKALLLLILSVPILAQTLEDFRCPTAVDITRAVEAVVTCIEPHGFDNRHAVIQLSGLGGVIEGKRISADGVFYRFVRVLDPAKSDEILIGPTAQDTAFNVAQSLNAVPQYAGVRFSAAMQANPTFRAYWDAEYALNTGASVVARAILPGIAGAEKVLTADAPLAWSSGNSTSRSKIWWYSLFDSGTGSWAGLTTAFSLKSTYVSPTQFTINRNTSTYAEPYAGQQVKVYRAEGAGRRMFTSATDTTPWVRDDFVSGKFLVTIPKCEPEMSAAECSKGFWVPWNQKAYMMDVKIKSFNVANGEATTVLAAPFPNDKALASGFPQLKPGALIWFQGFQNVIATQPEAAKLSKGTKQGFLVKTVSSDLATFTADVPLLDGPYSPTCLPAGVCVGRTQAEGFAATTYPASPYVYIRPREQGTGHLFPSGYQFMYVKDGEFDRRSNRLSLEIKMGVDSPRDKNGAAKFNLGTYVQTRDRDTLGSGAHFYNLGAGGFCKGCMTRIHFTGTPSHQVGASGALAWPSDPTKGHIFYPPFQGGPRGYMEAQTIMYLDFIAYRGPWDGQTMEIGPLRFGYVPDEPEEFVKTRSSTWSPRRFDGTSFIDSPGYEIGFNTSAMKENLFFRVRYSTKGSIKTIGWSNAIDGGIVTPPGLAFGSEGAAWVSPEMPEQRLFAGAIRAVVPIIAASGNTLSTPMDTALKVGHRVKVGDLQTTVTEVRPRQFWYLSVPGTTNPGDLESIAASGEICAFNSRTPNNLTLGMALEVAGSTSSALGFIASFPPVRRVISEIASPTSAKFPCPKVVNATYATHGAGTRMAVQSYPAVVLADPVPTGATHIESLEEFTGFAEVEHNNLEIPEPAPPPPPPDPPPPDPVPPPPPPPDPVPPPEPPVETVTVTLIVQRPFAIDGITLEYGETEALDKSSTGQCRKDTSTCSATATLAKGRSYFMRWSFDGKGKRYFEGPIFSQTIR